MNCIVNLSTPQYNRGRTRLLNSLQGKFNGATLFYQSEAEVEAPPHLENPYAFKLYAIAKAAQMGYKRILWLDASCHAVKPVQPIFDWIEEKGVFMEAAGHWAGTWANDNCLDYFDISREEAMKIPMFAAGYVGINFESEIGLDFFARWQLSMWSGAFKGSWDNHRHDMTCGSIIAHKMDLVKEYSEGGNYFAYIGEAYGTPKESVIFHIESGT